MTKTKSRTHSADFESTPKGAGHEGIVASAHKAPKIANLTGPYAATSAIVRRQAEPRISLRTRLVLKTMRIISTPLSKSP